MVPNRNSPRRHASLPMPEPIRCLAPTSIRIRFHKTICHSETVPSPNCSLTPRSSPHLCRSSYHWWHTVGNPVLRSDSRHSHNRDNLSSFHKVITDHRTTDRRLPPPVPQKPV